MITKWAIACRLSFPEKVPNLGLEGPRAGGAVPAHDMEARVRGPAAARAGWG